MNDERAKARQEFDRLCCNSKDYDYAEANQIMENFIFSAGRKSYDDCRRFSKLFARLAPFNGKTDFYPLNMFSAQRVSFLSESDDLFSSMPQKALRPDTDFIIQFGKDVITEAGGATKPISPHFIKNFENFIIRQIEIYDFSKTDIERMEKSFTETYISNTALKQLYSSLPQTIRQAQKTKTDREIASLNNWAFTFRSDNLLKKLSFRSTYINLLYERLIRDCSLKNTDIEKLYQQHRMETAHKVKELTGTTDAKGKIICRKYAINKVYKAQAAADNFKLDCLHTALEQSNLSSYNECKEILSALHGGNKSRNVRMPLRFLSYEH